jgi:hypothetical protein
MCFMAALFEGMLEVTDPAQFAELQDKGIGRAKGLGFGLLSVIPAILQTGRILTFHFGRIVA